MQITQGSVDDAFDAYRRIPEYAPHLKPDRDEFERRLKGDSAMILLAIDAGNCVGFKLGYDRYCDGSFYSWLGGVVPDYRSQGIAAALLVEQEALVRGAGYRRVYVKTRNRFTAMRVLLARSKYAIVAVDRDPASGAFDDLRLTLVKVL